MVMEAPWPSSRDQLSSVSSTVKAAESARSNPKTAVISNVGLSSLEDDKAEVEMKKQIPLGVLFVSKGSQQEERLLFLHPSVEPEIEVEEEITVLGKPQLIPRNTKDNHQAPLQTQFGMSTTMLAAILCVKESALNMSFEMKVDKILFVGHPTKVKKTTSGSPHMFHIVFALPAYVDRHVILSFQTLSKKMAVALNELQTINNYLEDQVRNIVAIFDDIQRDPEANRPVRPWERIRNRSRLAKLLAQTYDDVSKTGVVQLFVDRFIEIGHCLEQRALAHAHLTPRNRVDIEKLIQYIRPYHGILLLEDVCPAPDANPSVALMLKHCDPDRSIVDISTASGIPLMQVLLIVRHLLLWARAIVIYPFCNTNIYTSATAPKSIEKEVERFKRQFCDQVSLGHALECFNPPGPLSNYVGTTAALSDHQMKTRICCYLLRRQLIMQLHRFVYIFPPMSDAKLPREGRHCPEEFRNMIDAVPRWEPEYLHIGEEARPQVVQEDFGGFPDGVRSILKDLCGEMCETQSKEEVKRKLALFCRMAPFMNGLHHNEDIMYRLRIPRYAINEVVDTFQPILCHFLRPDFIFSL